MTAYERLCAARDQNRPTAIEYIRRMFGESFLELHGDRRYGDDKAVLAGIASLNGMPLTVIALEKGRNVKERVARNFGSAHPEGYRKALRLMKQAEKVSTAGAVPDRYLRRLLRPGGPRSGGRAQAIAENPDGNDDAENPGARPADRRGRKRRRFGAGCGRSGLDDGKRGVFRDFSRGLRQYPMERFLKGGGRRRVF